MRKTKSLHHVSFQWFMSLSVGKATVGGILFGSVGLIGRALGKKKITIALGNVGLINTF